MVLEKEKASSFGGGELCVDLDGECGDIWTTATIPAT
jgi:hypothetical protein